MGSGAVLLVAGAGVATGTDLLSADPGPDGRDRAEAGDGESRPVELVAVKRGSLSSEHEFTATVSFGDPWMLNSDATGTVTMRHEAGKVVAPGEELIRVDDRPLVLVAGTMPLYRELHRVDTRGRDINGDRLALLEGRDVEQLQSFLLSEGFGVDDGFEVDGQFGGKTEKAVKDWQETLGRPKTGRVDSSQVVFHREAVRIVSELRVGDRFSGLEVGEAEANVLVDTSNRDRAALPIGSTVSVVLGDGRAFDAEVTEQEQADVAGQRVWRSTIVTRRALAGEAETAKVIATEVLAEDVLLMPVGAFVALAEGGFAVEISNGDSTQLRSVQVGEVLDGQAEVIGDLIEGDLVVVPT